MRSKLTRLDSEAAETGPFTIAKDGLGELLAERAVGTMTSGDEPAEYNADDARDGRQIAKAGEDGRFTDEDEDDYGAADNTEAPEETDSK